MSKRICVSSSPTCRIYSATCKPRDAVNELLATTTPEKVDPASTATTAVSTAKAAPAPPVRPLPAADAAILKLSEPSSSRPVPAKSVGSTANSVESIFRPPEDLRSSENSVPPRSNPAPAV